METRVLFKSLIQYPRSTSLPLRLDNARVSRLVEYSFKLRGSEGATMILVPGMKRCKKCGKSKSIKEFGKDRGRKDGLFLWCKQCASSSAVKWQKENPVKVKQYQATWKESHPDYKPEQDEATLMIRRLSDRIYYLRNTEKRAAAKKRWNDNHPEIVAMHRKNYRAKKANGTIKPEEWESLKKQYNYTCLRCGREEPDIKLTLDHVLPLSQGGDNVIENAQPLCPRCNSTKGTKHIDYRPSQDGQL
jgi:5-methylcytosine-specific restriction endonuclease McrA